MFARKYNHLDAQQKEIEGKLAKQEASVRAKTIQYLVDKHNSSITQKRKSQLAEIDFSLSSLRTKRLALAEDYDEEKSRIEKLGGETAEIYFAKTELEKATEILQRLTQRLEELKVERGRGTSMTTRAEATAPSWPIEEAPIKTIFIAATAAFLIPFSIATLFELSQKRLTSAEHIEANALAPLVGEIARIPGGTKSTQGHRLFEESVDALRANMLFKLEGIKTIGVSSAMPGEGKSSVASQLAISLAKASDSSVLVIDADLRSPDQHHLFGLEKTPGLCKLLSHEATVEECIDTSLGDLVHVLPAGRLEGNPHNLLSKKNLEDLFDTIQDKYSYIVVDTAPILPAAESLAITATCDATLLCTMRDVSRSDHLKRTQRRLEASGANVLGTVFSGVPRTSYAYRYGDYRYARSDAPLIN